jgi:hypothetical protein
VEQVGKATGQVVRKLRTGMSNIQLCSALWVVYVHLKRMCILQLFRDLQMSTRSCCLIMLFLVLSIIGQSVTVFKINVDLSIYPFNSVSFCFVYFEDPFLYLRLHIQLGLLWFLH